MRILAFEFSTRRRSVAALDTVSDRPGLAAESETRGTAVCHLMNRALSAAGLQPESIDCLAVGLGPGSYTGIRNAIAIAHGWQLARPVRLIGHPSLDCLAATLHARGRRGRFRLVADAQRNEFYAAAWDLTGSGAVQVQPLAIVRSDDLAASLAPDETVAGPVAARIRRADGSAPARWEEAFPCAEILARLAVHPVGSPETTDLQPIYLRPVAFTKAGMRPPAA